MDAQRLIVALETLEPVDLKGVGLLRQARAQDGNWLPDRADLDPEAVAEATLEMMAYLQQSDRAERRLRDLEPVPLDMPILEWGL